jgi:hypothetical protein
MQQNQIIGFSHSETLLPHCLQMDWHVLSFLIHHSAIRNKLAAQNALHTEEEFQNQIPFKQACQRFMYCTRNTSFISHLYFRGSLDCYLLH